MKPTRLTRHPATSPSSSLSQRRRRVVGGLAALLGLPLAARAQSPGAPASGSTITLLVPYAAGGAADVVGRVVTERASRLLGQPIVIENRPGAGGAIAAGAVARSAPDGLTLLLTSVAIPAVNPHLLSLNFDPLKDLATVATVATGYTALVVPAKSPFKTLEELIESGRGQPGKLSYGSSGQGSITHLTAELFNIAAGIKAQHVPYKGNPQVIQDLVGGSLDFAFDGAWKPNTAAGLVRALAYTGTKRSPLLPAVPTVQEVLPGYVGFEPWIGFALSSRTPEPLLDRLGAALLQAAAEPDVEARLSAAGFERRPMNRREIEAVIRRDHRTLGDLIRSQGIKP